MSGSSPNTALRMPSCPICGKNFIPAPEHIYKIREKGTYKLVCSWGCVRKHEKREKK